MKKTFSLKDQLFNETKVKFLAKQIENVIPDFDSTQFIIKIVDRFPELELKERISWIRSVLETVLPDDYDKAVKVILKALPAENDPNKSDNDFGDFILAPFNDYIATHGCNIKYLEVSLSALEEITKRFSAEDAIRFFINKFPNETLTKMNLWSQSSNYHVRRLASEGTRPLLPWSQRITLNSKDVIPTVLDNLYYDKTRYVVRSVANHMNDISKSDPELVVSTLARWKKSAKQSKNEMDFLISHSLRTLVKKGSQKALELLGFNANPPISLTSFKILDKNVLIGGAVEFSFEVSSKNEEKLMIDYILHFRKKNGKLSPKVYKIKKFIISKSSKVLISKKRPLRVMTTKKLYPGKHLIEIQINGKIYAKGEFDLS